MDSEKGVQMQRMIWLLAALVVLQVAAACLVIRFGFETIGRDRTLLDRTETMMEEVFPGLKKDLGDVSGKASEIKEGVVALRTQLSGVEELMGLVGREVAEVNRGVQAVDRNLNGYVNDKSGLIWGHALNPYVLMGLLAAAIVCGPLWALLSVRHIRKYTAGRTVASDKVIGRIEGVSERLDELSLLVQRLKAQSEGSNQAGNELKNLVDETDRLIASTRNELALLSGQGENSEKTPEETRQKVH
jgi:hypothetical protein